MLSPFPPDFAAVSDRSSTPLSLSFSIRAAAEPGVMPRVLELFAKRGLLPRRCNSAASNAGLSIDIRMTGLDREVAEYIARCMRQIHGVETVFTTESDAP
jgi:acetolactate synthase regulatory subunit